MGKSLSVIQAELYNTDGSVVATGTYTFYMFPAK
jgi:acyl-coenzyme A thioesterase PaaI-like protein